MSFNEVLQRHCARAVPIILIDNAIDELSTVSQILEAVKPEGDNGQDLLYVWSMSAGMKATGSSSPKFAAAERYLQNAVKSEAVGGYTTNPFSALIAAGLVVAEAKKTGKGERAGFIFYMGDRVLNPQDNDSCNQCIQHLMEIRDSLKASQSTVYLVGIDFNVPKELKEHVVILQAPLPEEQQYSDIIQECYEGYRKARDAKGECEFVDYKLLPEDKEMFVESLKGMSPFAAEQTVYLSTDMNGMHLDEMRQRAIQTINSTRGLAVHKGDGLGFSAIGGLDSIKSYAKQLTDGRLKPKLIVYADEVVIRPRNFAICWNNRVSCATR